LFSIKNSFANCSICPLLDAPSCILETNCEDDLTQVEIIFIAENPGKEECNSGVPLIGKAGKIFREPFKRYGLDKLKYLLINIVLCQTINKDGTTGNPTDEVINLCKSNCFNIIDICKPKLIVLMGSTPMKAFEIAKTGITGFRGKVYEWKKYKTFLTFHPSFINYNRNMKPVFEGDFLTISNLMGGEQIKKQKTKTTGKKGVHYYKIPEKFYSNDYRLVDIQYMNYTGEVLYIFRDKDNVKIYHKEKIDYICYQVPDGVEARHIINYNDLEQVKVPYKEKYSLNPEITYEGDVRLTTKLAQDYYLQSKGEADEVDLNILYIDIETFSKEKGFPKVEEANQNIVMITYSYHNNKTTYVVDNKTFLNKEDKTVDINFKDNELKIYNNEKDLLNNFIKDFKDIDCDIVSGWHSTGFDIPYIFYRCKKIGINPEKLSKFNNVDVDLRYNSCNIIGCVVLDQLTLYRSYTSTKKENYKLGTISNIEVGETKLEEGSNFSNIYLEDINQAIKYNVRDVDLLVRLENKLKHISLQNETRKLSKNTFKSSSSVMGMLDSLVNVWLKEKGLSSKNANLHSESVKFEGAFVQDPIRGLHQYICDFDFSSLYPSNVITYNIGINTFVMKFKDTSLAYEFLYDIDNLPEEIEIIEDPVFSSKLIKITKKELIDRVYNKSLICTISGCFFKPHHEELSFYSEILENLLSIRKDFKDKMFEFKQKGDEEKRARYDTMQSAAKISANALYGLLGNHIFRFFNVDLARSITLSGQEALKRTIIESEYFVDNLKSGDCNTPNKLSKKEMYGELDRELKYVIAGDTDSVFIMFDSLVDRSKKEDEILNDIHLWCDKTQDFLNNEIISKMVENHNVPSERNRLELKNELLIRKALFLEKKHYAMWTIEQEGRKTDQIISMGISTKRSDRSTASKEYLEELLNIMLKDDKFSIVKINKFVERRAKDVLEKIKNGDKSIAKPAAWTKDLKSYKVVPQNVRGCLTWNKLLYEEFSAGDKGYLFKIQGIDRDKAPKEVVEKYEKEFVAKGKKLDVICVPDSEKRLPEYFISDVKAMFKFHWQDRVDEFLKSLIKTDKVLKI